MEEEWCDQLRVIWSHGDMQRVVRYLDEAITRVGPDERIIHAKAWAALVRRDFATCDRLLILHRKVPEANYPGVGRFRFIPEGAWTRLDVLLKAALGLYGFALDRLGRRPVGIPANVWIDDLLALILASSPTAETATLLTSVEEALGTDPCVPTEMLEELRGRVVHLAGDVWTYLDEPERAVLTWERARGERVPRVQRLAACERAATQAAQAGDWDAALTWCERGLSQGHDAALNHLRQQIRQAAQSQSNGSAPDFSWTLRLDVPLPSFGQALNLHQRLKDDPFCLLVRADACRRSVA